MRASRRSQGIGVLKVFEKKKTAIAPRSSPKLEPPIIIWE